MTRIKEILKEKGMSVVQLADALNISRQALSKQIGGKMLVETAERIATALDVPLWQLFASPEDVAGKEELTALIRYRGQLYHADNIKELKDVIHKIEGQS
ncbi:helix-turn-helix transcriptional regulator [Parabacteroides sp. W1-Q-101]|uniref:helix-turn-helix domain-containing protein n=1 Tax=Parabacteroides caeci TaxID=2949650 RepID=UPI00202F01A3|nr:helix-turn-helix transcriptional regulator [Parabacteroides sp. W1-Q-101]MCM0717368.1 helix-turn-helix transcriptional regulator [Parabacteroides sp. W1-Q-101]